MADNDKIYPGSLDRYKAIRKRRETIEANMANDGAAVSPEFLYLTIGEELAGLSYILDGLRYNTRKS